MKQLPVLEVSSTDEGSLEDEGLISTHNHMKQLKSGKLKTTNSLIVHCVVWPHELVYTAKGQPAVYDSISVLLFISGYMKQWKWKNLLLGP